MTQEEFEAGVAEISSEIERLCRLRDSIETEIGYRGEYPEILADLAAVEREIEAAERRLAEFVDG